MSVESERVVDISEGPVRLWIENRQLMLEGPDDRRWSAPAEEVAVVVLGTEWVRLSAPVLTTLAAHGGVVVLCDHRSMPIAMSVPLYGHTLHPQRLRLQIEASEPRRKRAWQAIVRAKVRAQAAVLRRRGHEDAGLEGRVERVRSGDPDNVEAEAARRYWPTLLGATFRRDPMSDAPPNSFLNYGYAVLRAMSARAVVAAGFAPALGLHHRHRENLFALADDLMEPFRPIVDERVAELWDELGPGARMNREVKRKLLQPMIGRYSYDGQWRKLSDVLHRMAAGLVDVFQGQADDWPLPATWEGVCVDES